MRIGNYVDGFKYYHAVFKDRSRPYASNKWLNVRKLAVAIALEHGYSGSCTIARYCTAIVNDPSYDPSRSNRQRAYLDALASLPSVHVHIGTHVSVTKWGVPLSNPQNGPIAFRTREEKGSDVSLGSYLVRDAALGKFDLGILVSNDSDLKDAVRIARVDFKRRVLVICPHQSRPMSVDLRQASNKKNFRLDLAHLPNCQLPNPVEAPGGRKIYKPATW